MKSLLLLIFAIFTIPIYCQSALDTNTRWTYSFWDFGYIIPNYISISADTVIDGTNWLILDGNSSCAFGKNHYPLIREQDDKWLLYNEEIGHESILYDFALNAGESYTMEPWGPDQPVGVHIDSTSRRIINGTEYKVQYINQIDFGREIIESIGSTTYLFPQGDLCDPHTGPIRCFENDDRFVDFDPEKECDSRYFPSKTNEYTSRPVITLYPNPAVMGEQILLSTEQTIESVEIRDQSGKLILIKKNLHIDPNLILEKSGIYLAKFNIEDYQVVKKIFVTHR